MRVYLTGFMGAGKSTVGAILAEQVGCEFIDLDATVEADAHRSVAEIFATSGEREFRQLEAEQLRRTERVEQCVVATGGGTPLDPANRRWMRSRGVIVWLEAPFELLAGRVKDGPARPMWRDESRVRRLFDARLESYRDCDLEVATQGRTPFEVATSILELLPDTGLR